MNTPRLSIADQQSLADISRSYWIDVDRSAPGEFRRLIQLGLVEYCPSMHAYAITKKGLALVRKHQHETCEK